MTLHSCRHDKSYSGTISIKANCCTWKCNCVISYMCWAINWIVFHLGDVQLHTPLAKVFSDHLRHIDSLAASAFCTHPPPPKHSRAFLKYQKMIVNHLHLHCETPKNQFFPAWEVALASSPKSRPLINKCCQANIFDRSCNMISYESLSLICCEQLKEITW